MSLADLLFRSDAPVDQPMVHAGDITLHRAELEAIAGDIACACFDSGVREGNGVAVALDHGADVIAALFGVWRAGAVYVPVNPRLTDREITRVLDAVDPALVITDASNAPRFAGSGRAHLVLHSPRIGTVTGSGGDRRHGPDVALIQFTSGTTGPPKAVKLTHTGVVALIDGVLAKLRAGSTERTPADRPPRPPMPNLVPVSLSLWAGIYNVLFAFRTGAPVVVMDRFDPVVFRDLVRRHEIRSSVLPPAAMTALVDDARVDDLSPLRYVRSITAPLSPLQARRFRDRFGISVLNGWGQTEIGGEVVGWNAEDARSHGDTKLGAVGRPHRGVEIRAVDDDGVPVAVGAAGELWVRTPAMSAGYADGTDLSDRLSADGWFRTGDVGSIDEDGFVWIHGRASSMINRGGLKVHPGEVEEVLRLSPAVADAAVVGVPDERLGEVPVAFVVTGPGEELDAAALDARCRAELAPYKVPVRFEQVQALPRNEIGKVLDRELVRLLDDITSTARTST
jgi:long-chain acyl-CoA synthetase